MPTCGQVEEVVAEDCIPAFQAQFHEARQRTGADIEGQIAVREAHDHLQARIDKLKNDFLAFLLEVRRQDKTVAAYGAAAKGNTLMNYAGIRKDLISFVVDRNAVKQGKYMPGSRIHIVDETRIQQEKPDYVVILPWNLKAEVMKQLDYIRNWGGKYVIVVPHLEVT